MNFEINKVKIITFVPEENANDLVNALSDAGAGVIGNYSHCSVTSEVVGTFRPNEDAKPYLGKPNEIEHVNELKVEVQCEVGIVKEILRVVRANHPYEEVAIDIIPLLDEIYF